MKKKKGSIYHWIDSIGAIRYSTDTGHRKDQLRYDLGNYMAKEEAEKKRKDLLRASYPKLSERQLDYKTIEINSFS